MSVLGISFKNNKEQVEFIRQIMEKDKHIIFCEGPAGSGKNFAAIAAALELVYSKKYKRIIYTRNPVQLGEPIGYLKGDADEKIEPYMAPLRDTLTSLIQHSSVQLSYNDLENKFEVIPLAFIRGRNIGDDTICILDEAQNCSIATLNALLTRGTTYSKTIVIGSVKQIDDRKLQYRETCDFQKVINALKDLPYVGYVQLYKPMRSPWCVEIDEILSELK